MDLEGEARRIAEMPAQSPDVLDLLTQLQNDYPWLLVRKTICTKPRCLTAVRILTIPLYSADTCRVAGKEQTGLQSSTVC